MTGGSVVELAVWDLRLILFPAPEFRDDAAVRALDVFLSWDLVHVFRVRYCNHFVVVELEKREVFRSEAATEQSRNGGFGSIDARIYSRGVERVGSDGCRGAGGG